MHNNYWVRKYTSRRHWYPLRIFPHDPPTTNVNFKWFPYRRINSYKFICMDFSMQLTLSGPNILKFSTQTRLVPSHWARSWASRAVLGLDRISRLPFSIYTSSLPRFNAPDASCFAKCSGNLVQLNCTGCIIRGFEDQWTIEIEAIWASHN